jgi:hypothetical protein
MTKDGSLMYMIDTNIWVDIGREEIECAILKNLAARNAIGFAPPVIIELFRGLVLGGTPKFEQNKRIFDCATSAGCQVLELPFPFVQMRLWGKCTRKSGVTPDHYRELMRMLRESETFEEFIGRARQPSSVWAAIDRADEIHRRELEKEFAALSELSKRSSTIDLASALCKRFALIDRLPPRATVQKACSAAIEFLHTAINQVRSGAKPLKNDPGLYIDLQLFFYLSDPKVVLVTNEDFSGKLNTSPQKARVISLEGIQRV